MAEDTQHEDPPPPPAAPEPQPALRTITMLADFETIDETPTRRGQVLDVSAATAQALIVAQKARDASERDKAIAGYSPPSA